MFSKGGRPRTEDRIVLLCLLIEIPHSVQSLSPTLNGSVGAVVSRTRGIRPNAQITAAFLCHRVSTALRSGNVGGAFYADDFTAQISEFYAISCLLKHKTILRASLFGCERHCSLSKAESFV